MPCSCSKKNQPAAEVAPAPVTEALPADTAFSTKGTISLGSSEDTFVDLAYTLPFAGSAADAYITSQVSKQFLLNFEPTYFQIPYIYSAADNLINRNYTKTVTVEDNEVITTYVIPYTRDLVSTEVSITTILNTFTNILFYQVPREFSYNSKEEASVVIVPNGNDYIGKLLIPSSFINTSNNSNPFTLNINIKKDASPAEILPSVELKNNTSTITMNASCGDECAGYCGNGNNNSTDCINCLGLCNSL